MLQIENDKLIADGMRAKKEKFSCLFIAMRFKDPFIEVKDS